MSHRTGRCQYAGTCHPPDNKLAATRRAIISLYAKTAVISRGSSRRSRRAHDRETGRRSERMQDDFPVIEEFAHDTAQGRMLIRLMHLAPRALPAPRNGYVTRWRRHCWSLWPVIYLVRHSSVRLRSQHECWGSTEK